MKTLAIISAIIVLFSMASCKHELAIDNPPEFPWQSVNEFEMAVNTLYNYAFYSDWGGAYYMTANVITEAMSDILYMIPETSENWPQQEVYYRQTNVRIGQSEACYTAAYKAINNINQALDFVVNKQNYLNKDGVHPFDKLNTYDQLNLNRQMGELHFMRAFSYYNISLLYSHPGTEAFNTNVLPLRNRWTFEAKDLKSPEFVSGKRIYEEVIISDLIQAIELLPLNFAGQHESYQW